ncbi:hypothetical protein IG631_05640 [Alternaria alternata]|nr:hypothetical protein IG631_05640 [Alternaria alternata]
MPLSTILNHTSNLWGRSAIYLLGQGGPIENDADSTGTCPLCRLQADISTRCSTLHTVSVNGTKAEALCEGRASDMAYLEHEPAEPDSTSDTLLTSLQGAPFVAYWKYSHPMLDEPQTQFFQSKIKSREYASGGVNGASKRWLLVLISIFLLNIVVLVYFIQQPGLVTDFSQPPQLFALALNSPPARAFAGSCGGGPEGKEYKICWSIGSEGGHTYIGPKSAPFPGDSGFDRIPPHQALNRQNPKDAGFYYTIIAALSHMELKWKSCTHRTGRRSTSTGAEPLRSSHTTQSVASLESQYDLGNIETQTQQQHISPFRSMAVP